LSINWHCRFFSQKWPRNFFWVFWRFKKMSLISFFSNVCNFIMKGPREKNLCNWIFRSLGGEESAWRIFFSTGRFFSSMYCKLKNRFDKVSTTVVAKWGKRLWVLLFMILDKRRLK
jgi:hypothetical protein